MAIIKLRGLSPCEAEEAIATLWSCLEEYGIPTPYIGFRLESAGRATLSAHRLGMASCLSSAASQTGCSALLLAHFTSKLKMTSARSFV